MNIKKEKMILQESYTQNQHQQCPAIQDWPGYQKAQNLKRVLSGRKNNIDLDDLNQTKEQQRAQKLYFAFLLDYLNHLPSACNTEDSD